MSVVRYLDSKSILEIHKTIKDLFIYVRLNSFGSRIRIQVKKRLNNMRRSKFVLHLDILRTLSHGNPMKPTQIMYKVNVCYRFLEQYLDFLVGQNLIRRNTAVGRRRTEYQITQQGLSALKNYSELKKTLPLFEKEKLKAAF